MTVFTATPSRLQLAYWLNARPSVISKIFYLLFQNYTVVQRRRIVASVICLPSTRQLARTQLLFCRPAQDKLVFKSCIITRRNILFLSAFHFTPSVLWRCWLGGRKGIRPVKKLSSGVLVWLSVWSEVQTCIRPGWCHCHSLSLASVKSRLVLPFWYWLTWVVPEKGRQMGVCVLLPLSKKWQPCVDEYYVYYYAWALVKLLSAKGFVKVA